MMRFRIDTEPIRLSWKLLITVTVAALLAVSLLYIVAVAKGWNLGGPRYSTREIPILLAQAPCFANVCPGMAGRAAIYNELSQNDLVDKVNDPGQGTMMGFSLRERPGGLVYFRQDESQGREVVEWIEVSLSGSSLGTVLKWLGEPDELFAMYGCGRGAHIRLLLLYRQKGIEVTSHYPAAKQERQSRGSGVIITEDTPAIDMLYFEPAGYDEWIWNIRYGLVLSGWFDISPTVTDRTVVDAIQAWPGLGVPIEALDLCPR